MTYVKSVNVVPENQAEEYAKLIADGSPQSMSVAKQICPEAGNHRETYLHILEQIQRVDSEESTKATQAIKDHHKKKFQLEEKISNLQAELQLLQEPFREGVPTREKRIDSVKSAIAILGAGVIPGLKDAVQAQLKKHNLNNLI